MWFMSLLHQVWSSPIQGNLCICLTSSLTPQHHVTVILLSSHPNLLSFPLPHHLTPACPTQSDQRERGLGLLPDQASSLRWARGLRGSIEMWHSSPLCIFRHAFRSTLVIWVAGIHLNSGSSVLDQAESQGHFSVPICSSCGCSK